MKEQYQALIKGFAAGSLDEQEVAQLESLIEAGKIELSELADFSDLLDSMPSPEETQQMDADFYTMLQTESEAAAKEKPKLPRLSWPLQAAAAVALILFSFWGGLEWGSGSRRTSASSEQVVALLETQEIDEKIHLVSKLRTAEQVDEKMIDALLFMLAHEESSNIKLACIDVLMDYSHLPQTRLGLVNAIRAQHSTPVLISIAEALEASGKKMSLEEFSQHLNPQIPAEKRESLKRILAQL